MARSSTGALQLLLCLHLDQNTVDAINRFRGARAAHLKYAHDDTAASAELFLTFQRTEADLARAVDKLLIKARAIAPNHDFSVKKISL
ncbi:hypothetical protein EQ845_13235 [Pseudomonas putida]|uniref:hypothetical protein n=1 Tax=Pseudomonas putida TaxID=303 RepID=UPI00117B7838|nr:hypothetical protein [Pseudomonas putida]TRO35391.1 hypothetical protein EQ845_13235 [Pseudomonas putida]